MKSEHLNLFYEEAEELIQTVERCLLDLEESIDDMNIVGEAFRALHTIKGSSSMFGIDNIAGFTHDIENLFESIRNGEIKITREIIDLTLEAVDQIKLMLKDKEEHDKVEQIKNKFAAILNSIADEDIKEEAPVHAEIAKGNMETYKIKFSPNPEIFFSGTNPVFLIEELKELGEIKITANSDKIPTIDVIDPEKVFIDWEIILSTDAGMDAVKDVFIFLDDESKVEIEKIGKSPDSGETVVESEEVVQDNSAKDNMENKKSSEIETGKSSVRKAADSASYSKGRIKVDSEKLDVLVNLVGELVTVQGHLTQTSIGRKDPILMSIAEEVERLTWSLRDNALNLKMVPIGSTFNQFNRLVRDLSRDLGKNVVFETEGGETELDKNMIEHLHDPLVHIIRNCIDHGIEDPENRIAKGKSEAGKVLIKAEHSGANVIITVQDDGAGLNVDAIRKKAIERNLISVQDEPDDKTIFRMIFEAGFSTAAKVTNLSGRGVGMDVVSKVIDSLRGSIDVDSKPGEGTAIKLKLPLTLAIIDGLLVKVSDEYFIVPLSYVEECVELTNEDIAEANGKSLLLNSHGDLLPYISLRDQFSVKGEAPEIQQVVVVNENDSKTGFLVDEIIGEHQTVIKSLGKFIKDVDGLSGLTILGNGTLALILDIPTVIKSAERKEFELTDIQV